MPKEKVVIPFEDFLMSIPPDCTVPVAELHEHLLGSGCTVDIKSAKSGYVVSYIHAGSQKVVANYVCRKKGVILRLYGDNCGQYMDVVNGLPEDMIKAVEKAPVCRRLHDPDKCNSRCPMGYIMTIQGTEHKKCRYSCFMLLVNKDSAPHLKSLLDKELAARSA